MTQILELPPEAHAHAQQEAGAAQHAVQMIQQLEVRTPADIDRVTPLLLGVKKEAKRVEAIKLEITGPLNAALKNVRDLFRPAETAYAECERLLKLKISTAAKEIREANQRAMEETHARMAANDMRGASIAAGAIVNTEAPKGITLQDRFVFRVVNAAVVPREFLMVDEKRVREHIAKHGDRMPIPGVVIEKDIGVLARG